MTRRTWLFTLLYCVTLSSGCLTILGEERLGAAAHEQITAGMGLVSDPELVGYVREIGERLVRHADKKNVTWRFNVVDMAEPNAFALPGGYVYVSRGLLALVNEEDELAGVIGHEIGHVTAGHANKRVTLAAPFAVITGIAGGVTGIISPKAGEKIRNADAFVVAPFSRSQERQSDRIGAELAAQEGWDPAALGDFLESLGRFQELVTGETARASWLDSHPQSPERAKAMRELAPKLERASAAPIAASRAALFDRLDGLILGDDAAGGVVVGDRFVHPELGWSIAFPPGWKVVNSPTAVAAQAAGADAAVVLQVAAVRKSLAEVLSEIGESNADLRIERREIAGLPAAHATFEKKRHRVDLTWIQHRKDVYQIAAVAPSAQYPGLQESFARSARSFRDARKDEIEKIRDRRLRIATVRPDEKLPRLLERVDSTWNAPTASVANAIEDGAGIETGRLIKYSRKEPYAPRDAGAGAR
jgi:predicted Zn-dependent protease